MNPAREDKCFEIGCLAVAVATAGFGALAVFSVPSFWLVCATLIGAWLIICRTRLKRRESRNRIAFNEIFDVLGDSRPILKEEAHYSFTHFTVTFPSERDMDNADQMGLTARFKFEIQNLYGHTGSIGNPFDAEMAVYVTYEGKMHEVVTIPPS